MVLESAKVDQVEPIVPMGVMMRCLGCRVVWDKDYVKVWHRTRGDLKVRMIGGCPQVSRKLALRDRGEYWVDDGWNYEVHRY